MTAPGPLQLTLTPDTAAALAKFREAQRIYEQTPCTGTPVRELFRLEMAAQHAGLYFAHLVLADLESQRPQKDNPQ